MDAADAGRQAGRTGGSRVDFARNGAHNTQKKELKPWLKDEWCIPEKASAEFVCAMEDTLEVYHRPQDEKRPLVCFDEGSNMRDLVDIHFPQADRIVLVMDNLNTHKLASLYEVFPPAEARRIAAKLEIHYIPKHGSWLNVAEIELSVLHRQCVNARIPDKQSLRQQVTAKSAAMLLHRLSTGVSPLLMLASDSDVSIRQ